jgi:hypothetical protein
VEKKIVVPEGMLEAVGNQYEKQLRQVNGTRGFTPLIEAALLWLSENPIVLTRDKIANVIQEIARIGTKDTSIPSGRPNDFTLDMQIALACEWQRRCFLAPAPEDPIKDLMDDWAGTTSEPNAIQKAIREAFRRGQQSNQ